LTRRSAHKSLQQPVALGVRHSFLVLTTSRQIHHGEKSGTAVTDPTNSAAEERGGGGCNSKRWLHYDQTNNDSSPASIRERNRTVTSYYNQTAIDKAAAKVRAEVVSWLQ
jgi:hypothetical protein